jgi:hypothetical protein
LRLAQLRRQALEGGTPLMSRLTHEVQSPVQSIWQDKRGQDLVEFAIILPVLLLLLLGIIQFGIIVMQYNSVANAARMGAREGIVNPPGGNSPTAPIPTCADGAPGVLVAACSLTQGMPPGDVEVTWRGDDCQSSTGIGCIQVTVSYDAPLIIGPLFGSNEPVIPLSATSTMEREQ